MFSSVMQGFQPNDLPVSYTTSAPSSPRISSRTGGTTSFSQVLERTSAKETRTDQQENQPRQQSAVEGNHTQREDNQTTPAAPIRADSRAGRTERKSQIDQNPAANTQSAPHTSDAAAGAAAQQADPTQTTASDETPKSEVTVTVSLTGSGDDLKVSLQGLPEELLNELLSACSNGTGAQAISQAIAQAMTSGTAKQTDNSALDKSGLESLADGSVKLTVKMTLDPADTTKSMNDILSLIQTFVGALQNIASNTVDLQSGQTQTADVKASDLLAHLAPKEGPINGAPANQRLTMAFKNLFSESSTEHAEATTTTTDSSIGLAVIPDSLSELKLPKGTDLTETLLSKVKVAVSLPGVTEGANGTVEKEAGPPPEGNRNSGLAEQGASMQASVQHQEPQAQASSTASFGSIVADRLAAVAEQIGLRDKALDITLRLKMDSGESLMVGLKDQAGKIVVQVRSADENMVSFLESQKETIVRNLEAKQVSSSISVSPIEEDVTKRQQGREQPKNTWGRRREPSNPCIETSI